MLDHRFPDKLCYRCYQRLMAAKRGRTPFKPHPLLSELIEQQPRMSPRHEHFCGASCPVCTAGNLSALEVNTQSPLAPTEKKATPANTKPAKVCKLCFQELRRGKSHQCTKRAALTNLSNLLKDSTKEQLAGEVIRKKSESAGGQGTRVQLQSKRKYGVEY